MIQHIAAVLDSPEQADRIVPCLRSITQPGVKIDFLIPANTRRAIWLIARTTALSTHNSSTVAVFEQQWRLEAEEERLAAERKLAPLREMLKERGAVSTLRLYSGSLKRALAELREIHPELLLVLRPEKGWLVGNLVRAILTTTGLRASTEVSKVSLAFQIHGN